MHPGTVLFGLDPFGWEVAVLCALAALALVSLIAGGFALLWRADRTDRRPPGPASAVPREFGLLALWRLERATHAARPPLSMPYRAERAHAFPATGDPSP